MRAPHDEEEIETRLGFLVPTRTVLLEQMRQNVRIADARRLDGSRIGEIIDYGRLEGDVDRFVQVSLEINWLALIKAACQHLRARPAQVGTAVQAITDEIERLVSTGATDLNRTVERGVTLSNAIAATSQAPQSSTNVVRLVNEVVAFMAIAAPLAGRSDALRETMAAYAYWLEPYMPLLFTGVVWPV